MAASDSDGEFLHFKWIMGTGHEFFFLFRIWNTYCAGKYPVTACHDDNGADTISDTVIVNEIMEINQSLQHIRFLIYLQEVYFKLKMLLKNTRMPSTIGISEEDPQWARFNIPLSVGRRI